MRKEKKSGKIVNRLSGLICIVSFCMIAVNLYGYKTAEAEYSSLSLQTTALLSEAIQEVAEEENLFITNPKLNGLREQNPDVIGWIQIPDTNIDYPIMQRNDNQYYMDHTFYGTENAAGAIFMEKQNQSDFSDLVTFIYGHRMRDGSMFGNLKYYESVDYWKEHPEILVSTYEEELVYDIFSVHRAALSDATYTLFFEAGDAYEKCLQDEKEKSWYDTGIVADGDDQILVLVTCTADQKDERIVILGRKR